MILLLILGTLWDLFFIKKLENQSLGTTRGGHEKRVRKNMIFEWLEPRKASPRRGESMILMFCPSPEKSSILDVFWYLLLELLGTSIVERIVFRGA